MPKFIAIAYGDRKGYDATPEPLRDAAHAHDKVLRDGGALMGIAGTPTQVRNHQNQQIQTENGSYMTSQFPVAGFTVIEAPTIAEAIRMVSKTPCAVANGVVEVWPLDANAA